MKVHKTQEIIECSRWFFPAVILSGWLSPLVFLLAEIFGFVQKIL